MSDGFLPMEKTRDMSESYRILRYPFSFLWCRRQQTSLVSFFCSFIYCPFASIDSPVRAAEGELPNASAGESVVPT